MRSYVIDLHGADGGVTPVLAGLEAALQRADFSVIAVGSAAAKKELERFRLPASRVEFIQTTEQIRNEDPPMTVFRGKPDSSMRRAFALLKDRQEVAGMLSCGSTGALLIGSIFLLGLIGDLKCPVLASVLPCEDASRYVCLLDCGANMDCTAEDLLRFARLGSAFMQGYLDLPEPGVALLNVGTEAGKGNALCKQAYALLNDAPLAFLGNCEANDVLTGKFDVVVCDGFAGNILLKNAEYVGKTARAMLRDCMKQAQLEQHPALQALSEQLFYTYDFNSRGGATLLGAKKLIVKAHGAANAESVCSSLLQMDRMAQGHVIEKLKQAL